MYKNIILIPIGGLGTRFKSNHYRKPKALINIFGKPLLYYLIHNLNLEKENLVYIIYNNEYNNYRLNDLLRKDFPDISFYFHCLQKDTEDVKSIKRNQSSCFTRRPGGGRIVSDPDGAACGHRYDR